MEAEKWSCFSEGTSDSESYGEDPDDDDEHCCAYASGDIPMLQFRKDISASRWLDQFEMAEVVERKGGLWTTTGIVRNGKIYCFIEETLYMAEIGALRLFSNDTPLSLGRIYNKVAKGKGGCSLEYFEAYKLLKSLGYIIGRHGIPWSVRGSTVNCISNKDLPDTAHFGDKESRNGILITEMFSNMQIGRLRPIFDVYPPNSSFRKSAPGDPCFVLCLASEYPPSKQEIEHLERHSHGIPLKFCVVEHGRVSFFSFNKVELPILP